jgi:hypothetical protein
MLPVNCGSHADYQNFVVKNLRKYYLILMLFPVLPGTSLTIFGILTFPINISNCVTAAHIRKNSMRHWKTSGVCSHSWNNNDSCILITLESFDFTMAGGVYPFLGSVQVIKRIFDGFHG